MKKKIRIGLSINKRYYDPAFLISMNVRDIKHIEKVYKCGLKKTGLERDEYDKDFYKQLEKDHPELSKIVYDAVWNVLCSYWAEKRVDPCVQALNFSEYHFKDGFFTVAPLKDNNELEIELLRFPTYSANQKTVKELKKFLSSLGAKKFRIGRFCDDYDMMFNRFHLFINEKGKLITIETIDYPYKEGEEPNQKDKEYYDITGETFLDRVLLLPQKYDNYNLFISCVCEDYIKRVSKVLDFCAISPVEEADGVGISFMGVDDYDFAEEDNRYYTHFIIEDPLAEELVKNWEFETLLNCCERYSVKNNKEEPWDYHVIKLEDENIHVELWSDLYLSNLCILSLSSLYNGVYFMRSHFCGVFRGYSQSPDELDEDGWFSDSNIVITNDVNNKYYDPFQINVYFANLSDNQVKFGKKTSGGENTYKIKVKTQEELMDYLAGVYYQFVDDFNEQRGDIAEAVQMVYISNLKDLITKNYIEICGMKTIRTIYNKVIKTPWKANMGHIFSIDE